MRVLLNAFPGVILLIWRSRFRFSKFEASLWTLFALLSLGFTGLLAVTSASTAVDRLALYMIPLQLVVFSHLPDALGNRLGSDGSYDVTSKVAPNEVALTIYVLLFYGLVYFVWLNYADYAIYWLPYRFYLMDSLN